MVRSSCWRPPSPPDSSWSLKKAFYARSQHYPRHQQQGSVGSESHWLRFGSLEEVDGETFPPPKPQVRRPRSSRRSWIFGIFACVPWRSKVLGRTGSKDPEKAG
ncbi:hypothetical protein TWF696_007460 [Orbilia brochopaga]|uniref:Uncharacterized protein n=1 Tax=Orbilia brochopaga TaxID=3140254 RepID=A0AAV9ULT2_9PEZI